MQHDSEVSMWPTEIRDAKYIALETFRRDGQGVVTPVWQVPDGDMLYVWTDADSWKTKRIRANSHVRLCRSDARGNPTGPWIEGKAQVLDGDLLPYQRLMTAKYGLFFQAYAVLWTVMKKASVVIGVTTDQVSQDRNSGDATFPRLGSPPSSQPRRAT